MRVLGITCVWCGIAVQFDQADDTAKRMARAAMKDHVASCEKHPAVIAYRDILDRWRTLVGLEEKEASRTAQITSLAAEVERLTAVLARREHTAEPEE